jgi:hypothetical protein
MYPKLNVYLNDQAEPTVVQPITVDFELAEELYGAKRVTDSGLRLVVAYCQITGSEPKNLAEVRKWAREQRVQVTIGDAPDPTQTGLTGD